MSLRLTYGVGPKVKNGGGEYCASVAEQHAFDEMIERAYAARGDDWHADRIGHRPRQRHIEAALGAIAVHRGEQDLSGAQSRDLPRERHGVNAGRVAPAVSKDLPAICFTRL